MTAMPKPILAVLALFALGLTACGSAADNPPAAVAPATVEQSAAPAAPVPAAVVDPAAPVATAAQPAVAQPSAPAAAVASQSATANPEPGFDDARVEGLVAEWETDLALIAQVAECVERELRLERPLRPEDFQLQAHQPAIVTCIAREVGNE